MSPHLRTVIRTESHRNKKLVWWYMVTIESNGTEHRLTVTKEATPASVKRIATAERVTIEESI